MIQEAIVYSDGASRGNPGLAGAGWVIQSPNGENIQNGNAYLGTMTNNEAEYEAAIRGLEAALALGIKIITLRADSELIIKQLKGEYKVRKSHLLIKFDRAKSFLNQFQQVKLEYIPREKNKEADRQANLAIDQA